MLLDLLEIPKSEWQDVWIRLPRHEWPKPWANIEDPVVPLERNFIRTPTCWTVVGKTLGRSCLRTWIGKKVPNWESLSVHRKTGIILIGIRG